MRGTIASPPPPALSRGAGASWAGPILAIVFLLAAFAWLDSLAGISTNPTVVLTVLGLGGLAATMLLIGRSRGMRRAMLAIIVYGLFASSVMYVRRSDWNPRKAFLRGSVQIRPGMTRDEVESVMRRVFAGRKAPAAKWEPGAGHYILDPDDGAYNAETLTIQMSHGRVISSAYSFD